MHITAQGPPVSENELYCVEWDVKLYYTMCLTAGGSIGAELSGATYTPVILDRGLVDGVRRLLFGAGFEFWLHRVLFLDTLSFLSHGRLGQPLDRYILVDVDDVFVGRSGVRLTEPDVLVPDIYCLLLIYEHSVVYRQSFSSRTLSVRRQEAHLARTSAHILLCFALLDLLYLGKLKLKFNFVAL